MPAPPRSLLLVASAVSALDSAAIVTTGTALAVWRDQHGLDDWQVGTLSATLTLCIALGALVGGRAADVRGRTSVFTMSVTGYVAGAAIVAAAPGFVELVVGLALLGLSAGADLPASLALIADHAPPALRARLIATTHVMWTVGIVLASAAGWAVAPWGAGGVRGLFAVLALCAVGTWVARRSSPAFAAVAAGERRSATTRDDTRRREPLRDLLRRRELMRSLVLLTTYYAVYTLVANTFGSFRTYLLVVVGGATQERATATAFVLTVVGLAGTVVFSRLVGGAARTRAYAWGAGALVASQLLAVWAIGASFDVVLLSLVIYALAYPYAGEGIYKVWTQETFPSDCRASAQGFSLAVARTLAAAFALVTPRLLATEPRALFALLACFATTSAMLGWRLRPRTTGLRSSSPAPRAGAPAGAAGAAPRRRHRSREH